MEKRIPKETDQEQIEKGFNLIKDLINEHSEIEPILWTAACWNILLQEYSLSGRSYEEFTRIYDEMNCRYKSWFG